mgnify:FL=1
MKLVETVRDSSTLEFQQARSSLMSQQTYSERTSWRRDVIAARLGLEADIDGRKQEPSVEVGVAPITTLGRLDGLLSLIAEAEAGSAGYDAIQHRARIKTPRPPSKMTLGEIFQWIEQTPGQQHAIGRYQIIPSTLKMLMDQMQLGQEIMFSPPLQDAMAIQLMINAGLDEFRAGIMSDEDFLDALAWIWAGLPLGTGYSAYHGFNGNYAVISRREYETQFRSLLGTSMILAEKRD